MHPNFGRRAVQGNYMSGLPKMDTSLIDDLVDSHISWLYFEARTHDLGQVSYVTPSEGDSFFLDIRMRPIH